MTLSIYYRWIFISLPHYFEFDFFFLCSFSKVFYTFSILLWISTNGSNKLSTCYNCLLAMNIICHIRSIVTQIINHRTLTNSPTIKNKTHVILKLGTFNKTNFIGYNKTSYFFQINLWQLNIKQLKWPRMLQRR